MGSFLSFSTRFRNDEFRQKRMVMVSLPDHDRHHQRPDQQPPDQGSPGLPPAPLQQCAVAGVHAFSGQLLPFQFQLYFVSCLQPLCNVFFHIPDLTAYQSLVGTRPRMGLLHLLCTGLCRCPLPAGCSLRRPPGLTDRLAGQPRLPIAGRHSYFTTQSSLPCLK